MSSAPTRPAMKYFGGKWLLAPWLLQFFPPHKIYVEPYGGGASVLMRKRRVPIEVYNDLDESVVNVFRVLRDPSTAVELERVTRLTPFSRRDYEETYHPCTDPVDRARRTIFRSFSAFGSSAHVRNKTGFRSKDNAGAGHACTAWARWPDQISAFTERLRGVVIECRSAVEVIRIHDSAETLFYVDPPYVTATRNRGQVRRNGRARTGDYAFEMTDEDHSQLSAVLHEVAGAVVVSGYPSPLYNELYDGWFSVARPHIANGGKNRTEVIWLNARAAGALQQSNLFTATGGT